jgi:hypothetical protein
MDLPLGFILEVASSCNYKSFNLDRARRNSRRRFGCVKFQVDVVYYVANGVAKGYRSVAGVAQIVKIAFLQGDLGKEIFMTQPGAFTAADVSQAMGLVCRHMSDPGARCFKLVWRTGQHAGRQHMMI